MYVITYYLSCFAKVISTILGAGTELVATSMQAVSVMLFHLIISLSFLSVYSRYQGFLLQRKPYFSGALCVACYIC